MVICEWRFTWCGAAAWGITNHNVPITNPITDYKSRITNFVPWHHPSGVSKIESFARHPRTAVLILLGVTLLPAWLWIILMARDMYGSMQGPSAWMMSLTWDWPRVFLLWAMWAVMMAAMMLPGAAPVLLLFAAVVRNREPEAAAAKAWLLAAGYVLVWAVFSVGATALQRLLARLLVLTPMMEPAMPVAGAILLTVAGLYQLTPLKRVCLRTCRSPLTFLMQHWRPGRAGALRMGIDQGIHCLGCCWALMLLLFAGGVMNLIVILALTVWVLVEKLGPFGEQTARAAGIALLGLAAWMFWAA
jgi:predicted metal-binding membrane protein